MKKIKELIKKNYILSTIIFSVICLAVIAFLIYRIVDHNLNKVEYKEENTNLYTYFLKNKKDINAHITYANDVVSLIKEGNNTVNEPGVLYYKNSKEAIMGSDSFIVFYIRNADSFYLKKYAKISNNEDVNIVNNITSNNFFIYDGDSLFFFPEEVLLKVDGNEIKLSAYSYVSVEDDLVYYNYETDRVYVIENFENGTVTINNAKIDLVSKAIVVGDNVKLLPHNNNLKEYVKEKKQ